MGNSCFTDQRPRFLNMAKEILLEKYPATDFRVRFVELCIVRDSQHRFTHQDQEQLRYVFHAEDYSQDDHRVQMEDLEERMNNQGKLHKYPDYGDE